MELWIRDIYRHYSYNDLGETTVYIGSLTWTYRLGVWGDIDRFVGLIGPQDFIDHYFDYHRELNDTETI